MTRIIAIVPAAGSGSRVGDTLPKQYLPIGGVPMIVHTLRALMRVPRLDRIVAVLSPHDRFWETLCTPHLPSDAMRLQAAKVGGATRATSVVNGIAAIAGEFGRDDWVLVHDAARPCILPGSIERLLDELSADPVGGLLALPVADTLKAADAETRAMHTVDRSTLWRAQTPQMFRLGVLQAALAAMPSATDEAQAMEAQGHRPRLVMGDAANLKVTYPADLKIAQVLLQMAEEA